MTKRFTALPLLAVLTLPLNTYAQSTTNVGEAVKTSTSPSLFKNLYSTVEARHYMENDEIDSKSKKLSYKSFVQGRFNLGSKFFSEKLDSKLVFAVNNTLNSNDKTHLLTDRGTRFENEFTVFKNDYIGVVPFALIKFAKMTDEGPAKGTLLETGLNLPGSLPIATAAGKVTLKAEYQFTAYLSTKQNIEDKVDLRDTQGNPIDSSFSFKDEEKTSLNLIEENGTYKVASKGRQLENQYTAGFSYQPSFVKDLYTEVLAVSSHKFVPVMELDRASKEIHSGSAYNRTVENSGRLTVAYKINSEFSVVNRFDFLNRTDDGERRYTNFLSLVATVL